MYISSPSLPGLPAPGGQDDAKKRQHVRCSCYKPAQHNASGPWPANQILTVTLETRHNFYPHRTGKATGSEKRRFKVTPPIHGDAGIRN